MKHRVEIFQGSNGQWFWHVKAGNNKIIQTSGEGYKTKWGAKRAVRKNLEIDESRARIIYPITAILLIALIWALATRTTQHVNPSQGIGSINQQPKAQTNQNPQPASGIEQPVDNLQGSK